LTVKEAGCPPTVRFGVAGGPKPEPTDHEMYIPSRRISETARPHDSVDGVEVHGGVWCWLLTDTTVDENPALG
jgi:hypothetical protein